eukprot:scaffold3022_cov42-Cyclotella_meneghiniana.AAC.5
MSDTVVNIDPLTQFVLDWMMIWAHPLEQQSCRIEQLCVFHCHDEQVTRACREVRRHFNICNIVLKGPVNPPSPEDKADITA